MYGVILLAAFSWHVIVIVLDHLLHALPIHSYAVCNVPRIYVDKGDRVVLPITHPVVFVMRDMSRNAELVKRVSKENILSQYGSSLVTLTSSNAHSHGKKIVELSEYIESLTRKNEITILSNHEKPANETWYLFGNNEHSYPFRELSRIYIMPECGDPCSSKGISGNVASVVSGIGGEFSGVSFHFHGPGFSEALIGRKRWFLYAPEYEPIGGFAGMVNQTVAAWVKSDTFGSVARRDKALIDANLPFRLPFPSEDERPGTLKFYDCTIGKGEVLYFPSQWHHATLNLDEYTYFVSTFLP